MGSVTADNRSKLLEEISAEPFYSEALLAVRAARETSDLLRALRRNAGHTQTALAKRLGVSQARISQVESGIVDHTPPVDFVYRYAAACNAEVALAVSVCEPQGQEETAAVSVPADAPAQQGPAKGSSTARPPAKASAAAKMAE